MRQRVICCIASFAMAALTLAGTDGAPFEGTVGATLARAGTEPTHFLFTRKGNQLRTEYTTNKLEPINIIDFDAQKLTIVYPHNTTFVQYALTKKPAKPGAPPMPLNFPTPASISTEQAAAHIGPSISAPSGAPSPPPMSFMPWMPNSATAGSMMQPMSPPMSRMFGALELRKTEKTKKIQGFDCTLYTISQRGENFEVWSTNDSALFPFRLIERDFGRRSGPQMLEEIWPELLQNKSLFPLEAVLKMEPGGQERLTFTVDNIKKSKIDNAEELFLPPEKYYEIDARPF